ncbi:glutamine--fructose-6-phosphate transaminase (isomerizing) [Desulfuromonas sp. AOP6]|uniref:glutamine--fructose-6-phosphate transaminase (isomerizing) n=1 Tax=Desulfuromonas sp. AOP6 TaxID=1566351 RepID=UPI001278DA2A|nr:glutamine--fructose-6-phosphate transaminase (isomerizing) [Desulfuromonas sp. AOP6]BCA80087.1 glutamine--fructose-6-phosphate aminotransferase[isomerizing] [Desulfuromonas sp. AOP6]
MCGIVGAVAQRNVTSILLEGLRRLEYRGYDSAGLAVVHDQQLVRKRALGKVAELEALLAQEPIKGHTGIAHTRWATHGKPSTANAHPHVSGERLAVVHNGIIENHQSLKLALQDEGYTFTSDTDTEVIAHLLDHYYGKSCDLLQALRSTLGRLEGAYALGVMHLDHPDELMCARSGSPLVIGEGSEEHFIGSDPLALLQVTDRFIYLEEGDYARLSRDGVHIWDYQHQAVARPVQHYEHGDPVADKGSYRHYMLKEIYEQPEAIRKSLDGKLGDDHVLTAVLGPAAEELLARVRQVHIVACGTSYHAGLVARYWLEDLAGVACTVETASEFRYRRVVVPADTLFVAISQSGETADTLAALRFAKQAGYLATLAVCNVPGSSLVRESELRLMTQAGPEIGVASTKAFTTQLVVLLWLTLALSKQSGKGANLTAQKEADLVAALKDLPRQIKAVLQLDGVIEKLAARFATKHHTLFLGRGPHYPVAMEGALKLKEISYIHAEAYAAGELKHGPLALVDADMPVVTVAPSDALQEKLKSNLQEVRARGGQLINFVCEHAEMAEEDGVENIAVPKVLDELSPIAFIVPLQLLSYHVALVKGTDVDKPRNLAKSVTVE